MGVVALMSIVSFSALHPNAGAEVSGHQPK